MQQVPPPPDIVDGDEIYQVQNILDSREHHKKLEYFVKWEGYPAEDNSWCIGLDLPSTHPLVIEFHTKYSRKAGFDRLGKDRPRRPRP